VTLQDSCQFAVLTNIVINQLFITHTRIRLALSRPCNKITFSSNSVNQSYLLSLERYVHQQSKFSLTEGEILIERMPEVVPNSDLPPSSDIVFLKQTDYTLGDNSRRSKVADVEKSSASHPLILSSKKKSSISVITSIMTWFQDVPSSSSSPSDVPMEVSYGTN
jgi:hypothetical protein